MFTGIINGQGKVLAVESRGHETRFRIQALYDLADIILGESIAVNGTCLTVETSGPSLFSAYASAETMQRQGSMRTSRSESASSSSRGVRPSNSGRASLSPSTFGAMWR